MSLQQFALNWTITYSTSFFVWKCKTFHQLSYVLGDTLCCTICWLKTTKTEFSFRWISLRDEQLFLTNKVALGIPVLSLKSSQDMWRFWKSLQTLSQCTADVNSSSILVTTVTSQTTATNYSPANNNSHIGNNFKYSSAIFDHIFSGRFRFPGGSWVLCELCRKIFVIADEVVRFRWTVSNSRALDNNFRDT